EIDQIVFWMIEEATPRYALARQLEAIRGFNLGYDVSRIVAPTLIVAGTNDKTVPYENSEVLAEIIPNSRLVIFEGGSHFLFIEEASLFNRVVMDFLSEVDAGEFVAKQKRKIVVKAKTAEQQEEES
ncbi:MAG: alpha/beta hydrolase, partial [Candidatus Freyarchaeota archaeon]|nr:alpha/beta hydrolase [Candidatus Jordarchaeia archaeon]